LKIDMHVHIADIEALLAARQTGKVFRSNRYLSYVLNQVLKTQFVSKKNERININEQWIQSVADWVKASQLDKVILLALDAVFDESGKSCPEKTLIHVNNEFIYSVAARHKEFMFGASIHPYKKNAVEELELLIKKGACLIKWIPSSQYIEPDNPKCYPFYEALVHYGIPLLSHTGVEHTLGSRRSAYNHPKRLIPALKKGVKVIAAHCGIHLFLHEVSFFNSWAFLAKEYENMYGDSGAFSVVTRIPSLKRILKHKVLQKKLLYGSDFPGIPSPSWCWQLGPRKIHELSRISNPLERNMCVMQALDMPLEIFERAHKLLCINKEILLNEY